MSASLVTETEEMNGQLSIRCRNRFAVDLQSEWRKLITCMPRNLAVAPESERCLRRDKFRTKILNLAPKLAGRVCFD